LVYHDMGEFAAVIKRHGLWEPSLKRLTIKIEIEEV